MQKERNKYKHIIEELKEWLKKYMELLKNPDVYEEQTLEDLQEVLRKIEELEKE